MGTGYKGDTKYYRSIGQNLLIAKQKYHFNTETGYFGVRSPSTGNRTRNIMCESSIEAAMDFYNKIALGGKENVYNNGRLNITNMADGTIITMRPISTSDKKAVVEINISNSTHCAGIKTQKIHFVEVKKDE